MDVAGREKFSFCMFFLTKKHTDVFLILSSFLFLFSFSFLSLLISLSLCATFSFSFLFSFISLSFLFFFLLSRVFCRMLNPKNFLKTKRRCPMLIIIFWELDNMYACEKDKEETEHV